jgi:chemotaxis-related protein WspD
MASTFNSLQAERCWKKAGVFGDRSCERLERHRHCRNCEAYSEAAKSLFDRDVPDDELRAWTRQLAEDKQVETAGSVSVLMFRVRGESIALPTEDFKEVVDVRSVHPVPFRSNRVLLGLVNINGELVPCVSLVHLLRLEEETSSGDADTRKGRQRMVVVERNRQRFVMPVDEILGVRRISMEQVERAPATVTKSPVALNRGIFEIEGKSIGWLDEDRFFAALEESLNP